VLRATVLFTVALAVSALAVAVIQPRRAAAEDNFATIKPMLMVRPVQTTPSNDPNYTLTAQYPSSSVQWTVTINGSKRIVFTLTNVAPGSYDMFLPEANFDCRNDNSVQVDADYFGQFPAQTQTIDRIELKCPKITVQPQNMVGARKATVTLDGWNANNSFDSDGPYNTTSNDDPDRRKRLYLDGTENDGTEIGRFGYNVAPTATVDLSCGQHTVELDQYVPEPGTGQYVRLSASDTFTVSCPTWSVSPQGVISKQTNTDLTIADKTTVYPPGTTAIATFNGTNITLGNMTVDQDGHLSGTFSDQGYLKCDGLYSYTEDILVEITEPDPGPPTGGTPSAPPPSGNLRQAALAPTTTSVDIPVVSLCPAVTLSYKEVGQAAQPFTQRVGFFQFDDDEDPYNGGRLQPKTVFLNGTRVATVSQPSVSHFADTPFVDVSMAAQCGENVVTVHQPTSFGLATAQSTFTVLCPQISISPAVVASKSLPHTISLQGSSFHSSDRYTWPYVVALDGKQVAQGDTGQNGAIAATFPASGLACGVHTVTVTEQPRQGGENNLVAPAKTPSGSAPGAATPAAATDPDGPMTASTPLVVNCPATTNPPKHLSTIPPPKTTPSATLSVQPAVVISGMRTLVSGTGFTPGKRVTLTWLLPHGATETALTVTPVTADKNGTFLALVLLPLHELGGDRILKGTDGANTAAADALVMTGPMQPSGHNRNPRIIVRH
jgi:hypothetical protein